ncbi:MAG TPA: uroporphyrinogen decarboxylase [Myxococcales bacterium]|nr:uroporphyrinogen decarboxylase [Myxococcales bacterium]
MNARERMLRALHCQAVDRPPVWMMRQAGRTLPEYRAVRKKHDFLTVMKTPELACEVTLQPVRRFDVDAAILFSDILNIPEAMGQGLSYPPGGPRLEPVIRSTADVASLKAVVPQEDLRYVGDALTLLRRELGEEKALLGFAGAPFTLACYMVEGAGTRRFSKIKSFLSCQPDAASDLFNRLADGVIAHLRFQLASGADAVQLFDTWAGELDSADYARWAQPFNERILSEVSRDGPILLYLRNGGHLFDQSLDCAARGFALDWRVDLGRAARMLGAMDPQRCVQGNLDPIGLFAPPQTIRERVYQMHEAVGGQTGHIFNLGHGLVPDTPIDGIETFVDTVFGLNGTQ